MLHPQMEDFPYFAEAWDSTPIPRNDVAAISKPRATTRHRSLDAAGALGLILHHINSTMADISLQQIFGITPTVCSRYRNFALCLLQATLKRLQSGRLHWPENIDDFSTYASLIEHRHPRIQDAFGFLDDCHCQLQPLQILMSKMHTITAGVQLTTRQISSFLFLMVQSSTQQ